MKKTKRTIFIDRDGVINEDPIGDYIKRWEDFRFVPGAIEGLKKLSVNDFTIIIISNQAGIGDGVYPESALNDITDRMRTQLSDEGIRIQAVYYCLHGKQEGCACRKPKPGLFERAAKEISFKPSETYFIGDKLSDMQAGKSYGLRNIFVLTGHGVHDRSKLGALRPEKIFPSLKEAADYIVTGNHG